MMFWWEYLTYISGTISGTLGWSIKWSILPQSTQLHYDSYIWNLEHHPKMSSICFELRFYCDVTSNRIKLIWFETFMGLQWPRLLPLHILVGIHSQKYLSSNGKMFEPGFSTGFIETLSRGMIEWVSVVRSPTNNLQTLFVWARVGMPERKIGMIQTNATRSSPKRLGNTRQTHLQNNPSWVTALHKQLSQEHLDESYRYVMCTSYIFRCTSYLGCSPDALAVQV